MLLTKTLVEKVYEQSVAVADWMKVLLYKKRPDIFDRLDFERDVIYREPLLFTYFNAEKAHIPLEQILWGYMEADARLSDLPCQTEKNGVAYLPNYGYLHFPDSEVNHRRQLTWDGRQLIGNFKREELLVDEQSGFEVVKYPLADWERLYQHDGHIREVEIERACTQAYSTWQEALRFLEDHYPLYYKALQLTVRKMVIFRGSPNSFATILAHGIGFLNPTEQDSLVFFLDNIVHQCGHVIYTTLTFEKERLFKVDPRTPMYELSGAEGDRNIDLYGRYHGLFTQSSVNNLWSLCVDYQLCDGRDAYEIQGRFATYMHRFRIAVEKFEKLEHIFAEEGNNWFQQFRSEYYRLYDKHRDLIHAFNISGQPYVFDFHQFCLDNPPQVSFAIPE